MDEYNESDNYEEYDDAQMSDQENSGPENDSENDYEEVDEETVEAHTYTESDDELRDGEGLHERQDEEEENAIEEEVEDEQEEGHVNNQQLNENNVPDPPRRRGKTKMGSVVAEFSRHATRKLITFDQLGRVSGPYRSEFISFLGDKVRYMVGLEVTTWRQVKPEVRDKLWDEITVQICFS